MVESYKNTSKIATAIGAVATIISIIGVDQLQTILPQYSQIIPIIVAVASAYLAQTTENKRVEVAEQLVHEQYEEEAENNNNNAGNVLICTNMSIDDEDIINTSIDEDVEDDDEA